MGEAAWAIAASVTAAIALAACFAVAPTGIHRETDEGAGGEGISVPDAAPPDNPTPEASTPDPHAVIGAEPSHGPFVGGQRVLVRGKGFSSKARIWFGDTEADPTTVIAVDPSRAQVSAPPGKAGPIDITVQNGDDASTRRTLIGGYTFDALYAAPGSGPVPGGTVIEIIGQGTAWDTTSVARVDQKPCTELKVVSPTVLACTVPSGTPGSKTISVTTGSETILVLDAYVYEDSDNGYKGGLSGGPIVGAVTVLAYDNYTGVPIPDAHVILGSNITTAVLAKTDATGVAAVNDAALTGPVTVTVAAKCHSPITFVDVPVNKVTAYLDPVLSPACAGAGDPPPVGGKPTSLGTVRGELVWPIMGEFKKGLWSNVPPTKGAHEQRTAYLFNASSDATQNFQLPSPTSALTEMTPGSAGYEFTIAAFPGNRAFYALAGIEDRSTNPPKFTAYAMGAVNGVPVLPGTLTDSVFISMFKTLDQALLMDVKAPPPGAKGPDRLRATVSIMLGNDGYAILPAGQKAPLLPVQGLLSFVGVPSLDAELAGSSYVSTARAQTGLTGTTPLSVISRVLTTTTSQVVSMSGFVNVPTLVSPGVNGAWDGKHLATTFPPGGSPIDVSAYDIQAGGGIVHWLVVVPKGSNSIEVPDLSGFPESALPAGPLTIGVYGGRVDGFDYNQLRYRWIRTSGMAAYALDYFSAHL